jgi:deoxycytidylate deaminase
MIFSRDHKVMQFVRRLAIDNPGVRDRFKLSAALVIKRDIISIGNNMMRSHPVQKQYGKNNQAIYLHAEINAICNALNHINKDALKKATLYVYRVKKNAKVSNTAWVDGLACPCEGCTAAIHAFGINRVVHSTDTDNTYREIYYNK